MSVLAHPEKNIVLVSGPSGSGKDTLIDQALLELPFEKVITTTSRPKREHEIEGHEHYFVSTAEFKKRLEQNQFVEYSQNENGAYYGVERDHLENIFAKNKKLIWRVDWKGIQNVKRLYPGVKSIGILANRETLERRLRSREGILYTEKYFQERLAYAEDYFTHMSDHDYIIWNEDGKLKSSIRQFKALLIKITSA